MNEEKIRKYINSLSAEEQDIIKRILELKEKHSVYMLAHNYQEESIQVIADVLGDSLKLARTAQKMTEYKYILFCGVKFMAETASILNPDKKIIFPQKNSKCSMANYASADILKEYKEKNPDIPLILYINSTAEAKKYADVICTSSNSLKIVKAMLKEFGSDKFAFSPDKNLGTYISKKLNVPVDILPEQGNCYVHNMYSVKNVEEIKKKYPNAKLLIHPEAPWDVLEYADFIGSTSQIINYAANNPDIKQFVIGTEEGVTLLLRREYPDREFIPLNEDAVCFAMKRVTLKSILNALEALDKADNSIEDYIICVDEETANKAKSAIQKMMELS